jgi:hypothetical protein
MEDLPKAYQEQAARQLAAEDTCHAAEIPAPPVRAGYVAETDEAKMQAEIEEWLRGRGYWHMTAHGMEAVLNGVGPEPRGWYAHWINSERNSLMPDLLIVSFRNDRPALFLELKAQNKYQPGQKAAISLGLWRVAFSVPDAQRIIEEWERQGRPS